MRIRGSIAVVTGASSGIGRALALELASRGAVVTLAARRRERLDEAAQEISARFGAALSPTVVVCDVRDRRQVETLIGGTVERFGGVDVLVNNAGVSVFGDTLRGDVEDYRNVMDVNFFGAVNCTDETLPFMLRRERGTIVNISSVAGLHGVPYLAAYSASKAALGSYSQTLRAELADRGVRVMVVYPGYTETEIFDVERQLGGARRPSGTYTPPDAVARAVARGLERDSLEVYLTFRGRALSVLRGLLPPLVERAMLGIARELREESPRGEGRA
jgi:short-subunit dehydrogenase